MTLRARRDRAVSRAWGFHPYLEPADLWRNNVTDGVFGPAAADREGEIPTQPEPTTRGSPAIGRHRRPHGAATRCRPGRSAMNADGWLSRTRDRGQATQIWRGMMAACMLLLSLEKSR
jgi:hypothetical protein